MTSEKIDENTDNADYNSENTDNADYDSENTNPNIQSKNVIDNKGKNFSQQNEKIVTIKRSTYSNILKGIVIAITVSSFLTGYLIGISGNTDSYITSGELNTELLKFVTNDELDKALSDIELRPSQIEPQSTAQPDSPSEPQIIQVSLDDDPVKGNPDAPVTIVEFSDFQCPFCSRFYVQTLPILEKNYIDTGKVKLVYRDLPLDSIHPNAIPAHIAAQCANNQDQFWEYHDILFERQSEWNQLARPQLKTTFMEFASELRLDTKIFEDCLDSPEPAQEVSKDYQEGIDYGVTGTPTFFIGSEEKGFKMLVGAIPFSSFEIAIDSLLE